MLSRYGQLATDITNAGGTAAGLYVVAPDVAPAFVDPNNRDTLMKQKDGAVPRSFPEETKAIQEQFADQIDQAIAAGLNVIVPVQVGPTMAARAVEVMERWPDAMIGLPGNQGAISDDDFVAMLKAMEDAEVEPRGFHFLGVGETNRRFKNLVHMVGETFPDAIVTTDASRAQAYFGTGRKGTAIAGHITDDLVRSAMDDETEVLGALYAGELDGFSDAEIAQLVDAAGAGTRAKLEEWIANDELDEQAGDGRIIDGAVFQILYNRAAAEVDAPGVRTAAITRMETPVTPERQALIDRIMARTQRPSQLVGGDPAEAKRLEKKRQRENAEFKLYLQSLTDEELDLEAARWRVKEEDDAVREQGAETGPVREGPGAGEEVRGGDTEGGEAPGTRAPTEEETVGPTSQPAVSRPTAPEAPAVTPAAAQREPWEMTLAEWTEDPRATRIGGIFKSSFEDFASGKAFKRATRASGEQEVSTTKGRSRNELQAVALLFGIPKGGNALQLTEKIKKAAAARIRLRDLFAPINAEEERLKKLGIVSLTDVDAKKLEALKTLTKDDLLALLTDLQGKKGPKVGGKDYVAAEILKFHKQAIANARRNVAASTHLRAVQQAIEDEQPIPEHVLEAYPQLVDVQEGGETAGGRFKAFAEMTPEELQDEFTKWRKRGKQRSPAENLRTERVLRELIRVGSLKQAEALRGYGDALEVLNQGADYHGVLPMGGGYKEQIQPLRDMIERIDQELERPALRDEDRTLLQQNRAHYAADLAFYESGQSGLPPSSIARMERARRAIKTETTKFKAKKILNLGVHYKMLKGILAAMTESTLVADPAQAAEGRRQMQETVAETAREIDALEQELGGDWHKALEGKPVVPVDWRIVSTAPGNERTVIEEGLATNRAALDRIDELNREKPLPAKGGYYYVAEAVPKEGGTDVQTPAQTEEGPAAAQTEEAVVPRDPEADRRRNAQAAIASGHLPLTRETLVGSRVVDHATGETGTVDAQTGCGPTIDGRTIGNADSDDAWGGFSVLPDASYSVGALQDAFRLTPEEAAAADIARQQLLVAPEGLRVAKDGEAGDGALHQPDWDRIDRAARNVEDALERAARAFERVGIPAMQAIGRGLAAMADAGVRGLNAFQTAVEDLEAYNADQRGEPPPRRLPKMQTWTETERAIELFVAAAREVETDPNLTDSQRAVLLANLREASRTDATGRVLYQKKQIPAAAKAAAVEHVAALDRMLPAAQAHTFPRRRDFKIHMQREVRRAASVAGANLDPSTPQGHAYLVSVGLRDALTSLQSNANAVGWHDEKTQQALEVAALIHPELQTDPMRRFVFTYALAIYSNGVAVNKNFDLADQAYEVYDRAGQLPTNLGIGTNTDQINWAAQWFNNRAALWGLPVFRQFLLSEFTVNELRRLGEDVDGETGEAIASRRRGHRPEGGQRVLLESERLLRRAHDGPLVDANVGALDRHALPQLSGAGREQTQ